MKSYLINQIQSKIDSKYKLRFNKVTSRLEILSPERKTYEPVTHIEYNSLVTWLNKNHVNCSIKQVVQVLESTYTCQFEPFEDYLMNLEEWNGKEDHINELAYTVDTHNSKLWYKLFKKWFVGIVASLVDHKPNHTMLTLSGKQGIGKTTWLNNLVPDILRDYKYNGIINPTSKDSSIYLSECMLIVLDELEDLNKNQLGALKQIITNPHINIRRPYERRAECLPRRASFCASTNNTAFLMDDTGNRRFLCFEVSTINYEKKTDLDKVYAQALALYKSGFQYWLDEEDIDECEANNKLFTKVSREEELLLSCFAPSTDDSTCLYLTNTEIAEVISNNTVASFERIRSRSLGMALNKHNFIRVSKEQRKKYKVRPKEGIQV